MILVSVENAGFKQGIVNIPEPSRPVTVIIEGHSGKGIKGSDPFCAAVSVLSQTMILVLQSTSGLSQKIRQNDGYLRSEIDINGVDDPELKRVTAILEFFLTGMAELALLEPGELALRFE